MPAPARLMRLLRELAALAAVLLVSATVTTATIPHDGDPVPGHRCIHDEIRAKQFGSLTLDEIVSSGKFTTSAVLEVPRSPLSRTMSAVGYSPIRVKVFYEDVYDESRHCTAVGQMRPNFNGGHLRCTKSDIVTKQTQRLLVEAMIPEAIKMHSDRLLVQPLRHLRIPRMRGSVCGSFTIPSSVLQDGIDDADFVLIVATGPISGSTVAWAVTCMHISGTLRPVVGVINVKPHYIDGTSQSTRTLAHEMLHALGFSGAQFEAQKMAAIVPNLRGKPTTPVVNSPNTLAKTQEHYGCSTVPGMEVDNTGGEGTAGSHWSVRNARDDMMCGYVGPMMRYSAITIAAMEDTGFYKGNYSMAEEMPWGNAAGCSFIQNKCVENGVSNFSSMFCTDTEGMHSGMICSSDHMGVGFCPVTSYESVIPTYYQYFSDAHLGGEAAAEYCPVPKLFSDMKCLNGKPKLMPLSRHGPRSRCMNPSPGGATTMPVCADVLCDRNTSTYRVMFSGSKHYVDCPEGSSIDARITSSSFQPGSIFVCPSYFTLCSKEFPVSGTITDRVAITVLSQLPTTLVLTYIAALLLILWYFLLVCANQHN